ncbi:ABC transporter ATP-binding protein [Brevibacillus marinus]|uniref:ABC transporter ATP-binding protein n=1 Tax=Brevibacillus marinus TaxID=2496837 RepID=UPI000F82357E|nr:ABC transporter ATP-binding protein [Brevibacillus marinus]
MSQLPATPAKIQLRHVTHLYVTPTQVFTALKGINLQVEEGAFICLVGPSGCGKTTLLSLIAGLEKPTAGQVLIDGEQLTGPTHKVGYMLQQDYLFNWRTIQDNVYLGLEIQQIRNKENEQYALHLLEEMGLADYRLAYPYQLSGGMRQRVALARTLACDPEILLLDEPFSALDYQTKLKLEDLVVAMLRRYQNKTAILVTHDLSEAVAMGDRLYIMERNPGQIRAEVPIPHHIRTALPFQARHQEGFNELFERVWMEMERDADAAD